MKPYAGNKRTPRKKSGPPEDKVAALRAYAVQLHDRGDGHGVDWPEVAATLFKVAFACLDEAKAGDRAMSVTRRVHDGAYNRLAGSPDSATPYTAAQPERPPFASGPDMTPGFDHTP